MGTLRREVIRPAWAIEVEGRAERHGPPWERRGGGFQAENTLLRF